MITIYESCRNTLIICMKKRETKSIFMVTWFLLPPLPASLNTVEEREVRDHLSYSM